MVKKHTHVWILHQRWIPRRIRVWWHNRMMCLVCVRCGAPWHILRIDGVGAYRARVAENVCWDCEPEGW